MDNKIAHLQMIQGVISRMADNSFKLKGWSVVIVAGLFALAARDREYTFVFLAILPAIMFWTLDGYFLHQERLFRKLYDHVRVLPPEQIDFSMNTGPFIGEVDRWLRVSFSQTVRIFHGALILAILVVLALLYFVKTYGGI